MYVRTVPTHVCICIYVRLHVHIYRVCMHCKSYNVFFCTRPTAGLLFVVLVGLNLRAYIFRGSRRR